MEHNQFDALTRALSSRRAALAGGVGGLATLIGLPGAEEAAAHDATRACRRLNDRARRRACLRRARAHNRTHQCRPLPPAVVCASVARCDGVRSTTAANSSTAPAQPVRPVCPTGAAPSSVTPMRFVRTAVCVPAFPVSTVYGRASRCHSHAKRSLKFARPPRGAQWVSSVERWPAAASPRNGALRSARPSREILASRQS